LHRLDRDQPVPGLPHSCQPAANAFPNMRAERH
jgi:hypothetical protein